ncbi:hypothetical protein [Litchfieldella qijiaojingensis]|nr:hypothetical protein [Halomonas qijiaojingensis]
MELTYFLVHPGNEVYLQRTILAAVVVYILAAVVPFVPAAEIGWALMLMLGPEIAILIYLGTVLALTLAYIIGRAIPVAACAAAFEFFGFKKARNLVLKMATLDTNERLMLLLEHAPRRFVPGLLRHRYLTLMVALNIPGNTLMGGGGGIALSAGMSGLYTLPAYLATVSIAVAPIPFLIILVKLM